MSQIRKGEVRPLRTNCQQRNDEVEREKHSTKVSALILMYLQVL